MDIHPKNSKRIGTQMCHFRKSFENLRLPIIGRPRAATNKLGEIMSSNNAGFPRKSIDTSNRSQIP